MQEQKTIENEELKIPTTLKALLEALIFAAQEPLSVGQIRSIYQGENSRNGGSRQLEIETIQQIVKELNNDYEKGGRPYRIVQIAEGYQFATLSDYAGWIGKLYKEQGRRKLSQSGVETLAIVAYKQPITKAEIEKIRGVNCEYVLKTLLEKELLTVTGRADSVGRPLLYGTTIEFLKHFGLKSIIDLPRPREIEEILGESQFETERRMLEVQADIEQVKKEQEDFKSRLPHIPKKKSDLNEKEVKIVVHEKVQEIKIVPVEDLKALEEAGQEKIVFNGENKILDDKLLPAINDNKETRIHQNDSSFEQDNSPILKSKGYSAPAEKKGALLANEHSSKQNAINEKEKLSSPNIRQLKRWELWREKIKTLIRKLFD
jgi:segregation and condensation protein B